MNCKGTFTLNASMQADFQSREAASVRGCSDRPSCLAARSVAEEDQFTYPRWMCHHLEIQHNTAHAPISRPDWL